jgi:hypothetical protein
VFVPHWKHRPPRPGTKIALLFLYAGVRTSLETQASTACYGDTFTFLYAGIRTSLETQASTACYGDSFIFLSAGVRTSLQTQASTACYGDRFTSLYVDSVRTSLETQRSTAITGKALLYNGFITFPSCSRNINPTCKPNGYSHNGQFNCNIPYCCSNSFRSQFVGSESWNPNTA